MGFWDDPTHWPSDGSWPTIPGETVEGTITRMGIRPSRYGRLQLCIELDGDGRERWCNARLWRTIGMLAPEVGERIIVTRGPDEPTLPGSTGRPPSTWIVEKVGSKTKPPTGPSW